MYTDSATILHAVIIGKSAINFEFLMIFTFQGWIITNNFDGLI